MEKKDKSHALTGLYILAVGSLLCWLCSCSTRQSVESSTDIRHTEQSAKHIDSLFRAVMIFQQSIYEKQTALTDSFRHSEVRDTSRSVVLDAHGDTIREKTIIYLERNTSQSSKESTTERQEERLSRIDSVMQVSIDLQERLERMIREHEKETIVEKKPPWYKRILSVYSVFMTLAVVVLAALVWLLWKKKIPRHSK